MRTALRSGALVLATAFALLLGCGGGNVGAPDGTRVVVLGFDGMDYAFAHRMMAEGRMPNLKRLIDRGTEAPLETSIPPQSPVAWSNFITGMDSGGHGVYDFLHRDPNTYIPKPSTADTITDDRQPLSLGKCWHLPLGSSETVPLRQGEPFWSILEEAGVETTIVRMPANFPPSGTATREISGMGTSDMRGTDGTFSFFTSQLFAFADDEVDGAEIVEVDIYDGEVKTFLLGPENPLRKDDPSCPDLAMKQEMTLYVDRDAEVVRISMNDQNAVLELGEWSPWMGVSFEVIPNAMSVDGIVRFYLKSLEPDLELYASPIDVDPRNQATPISYPESFAAELADATGLFYTEGMPEDTKSLTEGVFTPDEFLGQARMAGEENRVQFSYLLDQYMEKPGGFFFHYFGNNDLISHVMYRSLDPEHPAYTEERDAPYADLIPTLYEAYDGIVEEALEALSDDDLLIVMSDHGFASWRRAFHLNTWLYQNGYLALENPDLENDPGLLLNVDWSKTRAYAYGFSGLYVNLRGRERDGIVALSERQALLEEIRGKLLEVVDPAYEQPAITEVLLREEYESRGALENGPDMILGYAKGWRGSNESALGEIGPDLFTDNTGEWSGDHMMDHNEVPGVLFTSRPLEQPAVSLQDLAASILREFGVDEPFPATQPTS